MNSFFVILSWLFKTMSVKYVYGTNILDTKYQIIAQQCNCTSKTAKGLSKQIIEKFPYANFYKRKTNSTPGTIEIKGGKGVGRLICGMFAQIYPGKAGKEDDEMEDRERYFKYCLEKIVEIKNLKEIAFPSKIGCGLAGGNWKSYERMILNFAKQNNSVKVYIVDLNGFEYEEPFLNWLCMKIKTEPKILSEIHNEWVEQKMLEYQEDINNAVESDGNSEEEIKEIPTWSNSNLEYYTENNIPKGWEDFFKQELHVDKGSIRELSKYLDKEIQKGDIYPELNLVFNIFNILEPKEIKVLIIGQDPYINMGEATGISFSVPKGVTVPPSLKNIYKELQSEGFKIKDTSCGDLRKWCLQGVFMLNTALTVRAHESASQSKKWLEKFTPNLMKWINANCNNLVILLWGAHAQSFAKYFDDDHIIIKGVHPSPLSAHRGFFGSKPFTTINKYLTNNKKGPIDWSL